MPFSVGDVVHVGSDIYRIDAVRDRDGYGTWEYNVTWLPEGSALGPQQVTGWHTMHGFRLLRPSPVQSCNHITFPNCVCVPTDELPV